MNNTARIVVGILLAILTGGILLPTSIAVIRNHPKVLSIVLWNTLGLFLLGLGWLIALILSLVDPQPQQQVVVHVNTGSEKQ